MAEVKHPWWRLLVNGREVDANDYTGGGEFEYDYSGLVLEKIGQFHRSMVPGYAELSADGKATIEAAFDRFAFAVRQAIVADRAIRGVKKKFWMGNITPTGE